ncbi:beta-lactamase-like protein [Syncephalastrum racemosum]|uniref:Beta-lactamase-like protein n=1 Tax=Syncephalastrum racemosum TaxID=13706 RepID=A0A1X2HUQ0_SYNRA|nr:beta-lactamase-like protein [Syncephalastrum racemosum]
MSSVRTKQSLDVLPDVAQLSDRVWRVLGQNPGPFTLQGTNTYLVGAGPRKILIDCGQGELGYMPLLRQALQNIDPHAFISDILITHCHFDHWLGVSDFFPANASTSEHDCQSEDDAAAAELSIRVHKYPLDPDSHDAQIFMNGFPDHIDIQPLHEGQVLQVDEETTLQVVHTGGHTKDHCCFWLREENAIFTGDCVLGHGTVVFDDLVEYLDGLRKLETLQPQMLYPGHGPVVQDGIAKIRQYVNIRLQREDQILALIQSEADRDIWTPIDIGQRLGDGLPPEVQPAYIRGIALHLLKLQHDGKVRAKDATVANKYDVYDLISKEYYYIGNSRL